MSSRARIRIRIRIRERARKRKKPLSFPRNFYRACFLFPFCKLGRPRDKLIKEAAPLMGALSISSSLTTFGELEAAYLGGANARSLHCSPRERDRFVNDTQIGVKQSHKPAVSEQSNWLARFYLGSQINKPHPLIVPRFHSGLPENKLKIVVQGGGHRDDFSSYASAFNWSQLGAIQVKKQLPSSKPRD